MCPQPFAVLETSEGIREQEVLGTMERWLQNKVIRKFAALLQHRQAGFQRNAMVVWAASGDRIDLAGNLFAALPEVTHCYQRNPAFLGKYNLFTMIHEKDVPLEMLTAKMAASASIRDFLVLESLNELKKTSMEYA